MRVLELYSGYESLGSMIIELGFNVVSCSLETFDINQYPKESNVLDTKKIFRIYTLFN